MTHVALLRGINVGGKNLISMAALKEMAKGLGFEEAVTILQSGNLLVQAKGQNSTEIEKMLADETKLRFEISPQYLVRSVQEWEAIVERNPYPREAEGDPSHLVVLALPQVPDPDLVKSVDAALRGPEVFRADGKQLYIVYPDGIGDSKVGKTPGWNALTGEGTGRNWNTVLKIAKAIREWA